MKTTVFSLSLLCGLAAAQAMAQDATATGGGVHCQPIAAPVIADGTRLFTRNSDLSQAGEYPSLAKVALIEGQAQVDCQIGADGMLDQCIVSGESRAGYGLGQALAITVVKWAQTDTSKPGHAPGDWLRFTTNWKLPGGAPAQQLAAGSR
ncbi:MAG: hypothetical protein QM647_07355 [Asticcacaulis sp.]|uniref:hypothetical protein n=1 Tax=Asticcacaulis sp. TaxID=1872648 RepID=UPI0039E4825B